MTNFEKWLRERQDQNLLDGPDIICEYYGNYFCCKGCPFQDKPECHNTKLAREWCNKEVEE